MENHGFLGWPNAADFTVNWQFTGPGNTNYVESNVINYNGASGQNGEFSEASGVGLNMPGIPPTIWPTYDGSTTNVSDNNGPGQNDYSLEIKTVIYLKAGLLHHERGKRRRVQRERGQPGRVAQPRDWFWASMMADAAPAPAARPSTSTSPRRVIIRSPACITKAAAATRSSGTSRLLTLPTTSIAC